MRIYLKLSEGNGVIPFNYQTLLTGVIHKWLGLDNELHGKSSNFSFSWIQNTRAEKEGIRLDKNPFFFFSAYDESLVKRIIKGILEDPVLFNGIKVIEVKIVNTPKFNQVEHFLFASPLLLKQRLENKRIKHLTFLDTNFEKILTDHLKSKLEKVGISSDGLKLRLNPDNNFRQTKMVIYKGIHNKTSIVPIIIEGTQEQIAYAWCAGLGNSTGIGFGALK